jgi:hypothetical protein
LGSSLLLTAAALSRAAVVLAFDRGAPIGARPTKTTRGHTAAVRGSFSALLGDEDDLTWTAATR